MVVSRTRSGITGRPPRGSKIFPLLSCKSVLLLKRHGIARVTGHSGRPARHGEGIGWQQEVLAPRQYGAPPAIECNMSERKQRMITQVKTNLFVQDQDRALDFYVHTLGFEKRRDLPYEQTGFRWIEVSIP